MCAQFDPLALIKELAQVGHYRLRSHVIRHMIEKGFDENNLLEVVQGQLRVVEEYSEESRYLILGYFHFTPQSRSPLHLVCDLSNPEVMDIVTAYIPQLPWWLSPTLRGDR